LPISSHRGHGKHFAVKAGQPAIKATAVRSCEGKCKGEGEGGGASGQVAGGDRHSTNYLKHCRNWNHLAISYPSSIHSINTYTMQYFYLHLHLHLGHLADAFIQSDLPEVHLLKQTAIYHCGT